MLSKNTVKAILFLGLTSVVLSFCSCTIVNETLYPLDYKECIIMHCDTYNVPYELVCAVIRTESSFDAEARSGAGAVGLMQLLPETAEEIASRLGEKFDTSMLSDPDTNIRYGCFYLSYLYRYLGGNWDTACAAYNAGIGRVSTWLKDANYSDDGVSLKYIPIDETRNYVEKINEYKIKYKELYFVSEGE